MKALSAVFVLEKHVEACNYCHIHLNHRRVNRLVADENNVSDTTEKVFVSEGATDETVPFKSYEGDRGDCRNDEICKGATGMAVACHHKKYHIVTASKSAVVNMWQSMKTNGC